MDPTRADVRPSLLQQVRGLLAAPAPGAGRHAIFVRAAVGGVFVVSGAVKFLYDNQGPGRFAKIGFPAAHEVALFVGGVEIACGALVLAGFLTRLAALPLAIDMVVALATTKMPLLLGAGPEPVAAAPRTGFWAFAYQSRLDLTMLLACAYLVAAGAGSWSLDAARARRRVQGAPQAQVPGRGAPLDTTD